MVSRTFVTPESKDSTKWKQQGKEITGWFVLGKICYFYNENAGSVEEFCGNIKTEMLYTLQYFTAGFPAGVSEGHKY